MTDAERIVIERIVTLLTSTSTVRKDDMLILLAVAGVDNNTRLHREVREGPDLQTISPSVIYAMIYKVESEEQSKYSRDMGVWDYPFIN